MTDTTAADTLTDINVASTVQQTLLAIASDIISHLPFFAAGAAILLLTWAIARVFLKFSNKLLSRWKRRQSLRDLIARLIYIAIWLVGLLIASMIMFPGLTPTRALGAMGLVSIAIGFAFRDIFENFFAGILILWRYPFETGDFIECEGITGRVEDITIRMSMIRKTTGELVVIPNSMLFKNPVQVLTDRSHRRVSIITGIAYGEDVASALDVIEQSLQNCTSIVHEKPIQVFPYAFGSSSVDIEVTWWTGAKPVDIRRSRGEVVKTIKRALDEAGIEIPFPYRTLTFKEPLVMASATGSSEN